MNILDENIIESQCQLLRKWCVRFRQIGYGVGRQGTIVQEYVHQEYTMKYKRTFR